MIDSWIELPEDLEATPTGWGEDYPKVRDECEVLSKRIAWCFAQLDAASHAALADIRRFDLLGGWFIDGAMSCAHWLCWRVGLTPALARERVRVARALAKLPLIDEEFKGARISYAKVRALVTVAKPENEKELVELALHSNGGQLAKLCSYLRQRQGIAELERDPALAESLRSLSSRPVGFGMVEIRAILRAEEWALLEKSIDAAGFAIGRARTRRRGAASSPPEEVESNVPAEGANVPEHEVAERDVAEQEVVEQEVAEQEVAETSEQEAQDVSAETSSPVRESITSWKVDALVALGQSFLEVDPSKRTAVTSPYEVLVLVDAKALDKTAADLATENPADRSVCELGDGSAISPETARRILCSAPYSAVVFDAQGRIRGTTRRTRAIPVALRRALRARDRGCRFPGCSNRVFVDAHHVQHWIAGGETKLDNLVLLCTFHHRLVHEGGFGVQREGEALAFFDPLGRRIDRVPAMPDPGESALRDLARENRERGSRVDHRSNEPRWDGTRMDYSAAVAIVETAGARQAP